MSPLIAIAIGSVGLAALTRTGRERTLGDLLAEAKPPTADEGQTTPGPVDSILARWDGRYQAFIQTHLDPWLAGKQRSKQMRTLDGNALRVLSAREMGVNRSLAMGVFGLGLIALALATGWPLVPAAIALGIFNSWPGLQETWRVTVIECRFSLLLLMLVFFIALWLGGHYLIGTLGIIFGSLCEKFELLTQTVTRHALTHLLGEQPRRVWVAMDGIEIEIPFDRLQLGDILVLTAGQPVPIDGTVVLGSAMVDQHRLTGESQPVEKAMGDQVLAATLVLGGRIHVRVEKTGAETTAARIGDILDSSVESQELRIVDQFKDIEHTRWPMLAGSALGWVVGGPSTAVAMLGCNYLLYLLPLRLLTLLNALETGTGMGILVKDGRALERLPEVDTVVFDKTGTLTLERQQVVRLHLCGMLAEDTLLAFAAAAEQRQTHPIAQAILAEAERRHLALPPLDEAHYRLGCGLAAQIHGQTVRVGSGRFLTMEGIGLSADMGAAQDSAHERGHTLVFVAIGEELAGAVELAAVLRPEAKATIGWLKARGMALYILSGDQEAPTRKLANELNMDGYFANTLPEQKAERVEELQAQGRRVCFVGDGINDAIALRQADVSVSLRGATTVATDAAQVVLMEDDLSHLRPLWELAQGFKRNYATNTRLSIQTSLLSAAFVMLLPFKFVTVIVLDIALAVTGIHIARQPLLTAEPQVGGIGPPSQPMSAVPPNAESAADVGKTPPRSNAAC
jgi:Cu2+-exporting ATPase